MTPEEQSILRTHRLEQADTALKDARLLVAHSGSAQYASIYCRLCNTPCKIALVLQR
jgi:hypothetical protein